jgi:hypothetical protein
MAARMQQRRGTAAQWTSANPILGSGEIGFETDTSKFKIGNGASTWSNLTYFANLSQILDGAPDLLNTLNEIAAAIGDDPNFITTIGDSVDLKADITYVDDEISDLNTAAQGYADTAESNSTAYTDLLIGDATVDGTGGNTVTNRIASAVSALVDSSPSTLNTLNELAAALNDDPSFATTISTSIGTKVSKAGDTMTGDLYLPHSPTAALQAATKQYVDDQVSQAVSDLEGADGEILGDISTINTSLDNKQDKVTDVSDTEIGYLNGVTSSIQTQLGNKQDKVANVSDTEIAYLDGVTSSIQTQLGNKQDKVTDVSDTEIGYLNGVTSAIQTQIDTKAPINSPTFTGSVVLPTTTTIGDVSDTEISHLNGVTSALQAQIDAKLSSATATGIYAPLNDPTFGGTVSLPGTTSIGDVSATEIGYLNGVTSSVQTQLTDLDTTKADLESPTFTGTVSGVTKSHVGLSNVDNTTDADKPVSTAQQTALDTKLNLAGGTMTGKITLDGDPTQALHAATKEYVDNTASGIVAKPQVLGATTANIDATYENGTAGVGATLTHNTNGVFPSGAGGASGWAVGKGILVKNQTNKEENGRYYVSNMGSVSTPYVLTRCGYCDEADEIPGAYIFVQDGTNAGTGWIQVVEDPTTFVVGTDDIDVFQFSGAGTVTAGTNVSVDGNQVSVIDAPVFTGIVDASAAGVEFSDGVQTKAGVPSLTTFVEKTADYTLDTLAHQDNLIEMNSTSPMTFTIPTNATLAWPIGASMDILQTNTGEVTIAAVGGVTLNRTPGNKLRTQWSSATILKRGTDSWILYGDLKA